MDNEIRESLDQEFTEIEVKEALFQMHPMKSPGPEGLPPFFYHKFWDIVGRDVTAAILSFMSSGRLLWKVNYMYVTLIPKQKQPIEMAHFWPISLAKVLYKIASKFLINRLKPIMPKIIS